MVIENATNGRYLTTGHLVFLRDAALHAVPFDADRLAVTGPPVRLGDGVAVASAGGGAQFDVSADGLLVYALADEQAVGQEWAWVDRDGAETAITIGVLYEKPLRHPIKGCPASARSGAPRRERRARRLRCRSSSRPEATQASCGSSRP